MTNVVAISRCKNEADIIEPWVRHTLAHVDRIVVSDNDSADDTLEILQALVAEGLPITLLREKTVGDYQSRVFTQMMHDVAPSADWVVPLDTDEFVECQVRLATELNMGPNVVRALPWKSMAWSPLDDQSEINPVIRMRRRLVEETHYRKISVPFHLALTSTLCTGSHFLLPAGDHGTLIKGARICHFPLRSIDQYRLKASLAYLQSLCVPGWDRRTGFQFSSLPDAAGLGEETLAHFSLRYASQMPQDWIPETIDQPLDYRGGPLKYTRAGDRFIPLVLRYAETLALKIAELT